MDSANLLLWETNVLAMSQLGLFLLEEMGRKVKGFRKQRSTRQAASSPAKPQPIQIMILTSLISSTWRWHVACQSLLPFIGTMLLRDWQGGTMHIEVT